MDTKKTTWLLLILVFILSFIFDSAIVSLMNAISNRYIDYMMKWFSHLGSVFAILFITSLFLWEEKKREWIPILVLSFVSSLALSYVFKFIFLRPRPLNLEKFLLGIPDYSFPSTHAAISFACVPVLDREFPVLKWFWIGFALLVSISRVYLVLHHLSDVVAGIILGYFSGYLLVKIEEKHGIFKRIKHKA